MRMEAAVLDGPTRPFAVREVGRDVPALVERYLDGEPRLDELVSARIDLGELDDGFARLREGTEARQVVVFKHREEWHVN